MSEIQRLLQIMARLRHPTRGCPWDREQTFASIAPYTVEEAYEVAEAIEADDREALREELGDLLFQVVFHARMAEEEGAFGFEDVARAIAQKMQRRHPHVFGDARVDTARAQTHAWEAHKAGERREKGLSQDSHLEGVSVALPAMTRAVKLQRRAARVGFDWDALGQVLAKLEEEIGELREAMAQPDAREQVLREMGDLLFTCANLARHLELDPEAVLRSANTRFETRFRRMEWLLVAAGTPIASASPEAMDAAWEQAKREER